MALRDIKNLSHKEEANIAQVGKRSEKIAEFDGIRLGRDLEDVLPSKLALMNDENFKNAGVLVINDFEFAKINLSKDEVDKARFYRLNVSFEKTKDEFFDEIIDYEQDLSLDI